MKHLAKSIALSAHAEQAIITLDGVSHPLGATWHRRETDVDLLDEDHIAMESTIRVPASELPRQPVYGDPVQIDGRSLFVDVCYIRGPVYLITLTHRGPR